MSSETSEDRTFVYAPKLERSYLEAVTGVPEQLVGIDDPNYKPQEGESYIDNVMRRHEANQKNETFLTDKDTQKRIADMAKELIQWIEEYAVPFAITQFRAGVKGLDTGKIRWLHLRDPSRVIIHFDIDFHEYLIQTNYSIYNVTHRVVEMVASVMAAKTGLEVERAMPQNPTLYQRISLVIPI